MKKCSVEDVKELHLFQNINNTTCEKLSSIGVIRLLKKGEHLFRDKDQVKNIYIVKSGKVALYKLTESAQKKVIFILGDNTVINDVIIDELPASINCEVFEDAEILCFKREAFIGLMNEDFELSIIIINSLALKVRRLYRQSKNTISIKVEKKLAAKLWKLSKDYGIEVEEGILINLNLSITYLADMLGIPRETISRALKILQKKELIISENKKIIVTDREELAKFFKDI